MTPQEQAIAGAFTSPAFRLGVSRGLWRLLRRDGVVAIIAIACADRGDEVNDYLLHFDLTNYPREAPTGFLWDEDAKIGLPQARWPTGGERITQVFNAQFHPGRCLYLPCDRFAIANHGTGWVDGPENQPFRWQPERGLVFYLEIVSELLNSKDYTGRYRSA